MEELFEVVFSMQSTPRLHKESIVHRELVCIIFVIVCTRWNVYAMENASSGAWRFRFVPNILQCVYKWYRLTLGVYLGQSIQTASHEESS